MLRWADNNLLDLKWEEIGEHYGRYRLHVPEAERAMARSLERYGQLSPVVVCRRQDRYELIDGFKRLSAVRGQAQIPRLSARLLEADERQAKAAIYGLNRAGGRTRELEEAWIIQALVREDGLSQVEVAELLGRHKSWVCRRLGMWKALSPRLLAEGGLQELEGGSVRRLALLPVCNQEELIAVSRREALGARDTTALIGLWAQAPDSEARRYLIDHPREAIALSRASAQESKDPRLGKVAAEVLQSMVMMR